jgi:alcohol dehydrogenase class IV
VAHLLTGSAGSPAEAGVEWVRKLVADLGIPRLGQYGIKPEHTDGLVEKASHASSMKANPIALTREELSGILNRAR